jgi:hypothetical protein
MSLLIARFGGRSLVPNIAVEKRSNARDGDASSNTTPSRYQSQTQVAGIEFDKSLEADEASRPVVIRRKANG